MDLTFTHLSYWIWGAKDRETPNSSSSSSPDSPSMFREPDYVEFRRVDGSRIRANSRRAKKKSRSREEKWVDKEYDIVLVPSDDGGCLSGSESDDSDWSIGWLEPHSAAFRSKSEDEAENSFAVLVRCYGRGSCEKVDTSKNIVFCSLNLMEEFPDSYTNVEDWLSSV